MKRDTEILEAGYPPPKTAGAFVPALQFSSTFVAGGDPSQHQLTYGRFHNPTWTVWEQALGVLDGGHAISFASGMAALDALFGVSLQPGDAVVLPADSYYSTRVFASNWLAKIGVQVRLAPSRGEAQADALAGARLLLIETPTNPQLDVCDIRHLADVARERGVLVAVDNTTATAYLQQPLALGADYVVASDTKALTGHSDLVLGHVSTASDERAAALRAWRTQHGAIPGPMETWLAHRSLATLPLRLTRQCASAAQIAGHLRAAAGVSAVYLSGASGSPRTCRRGAPDARVRLGPQLRPRHAHPRRDVSPDTAPRSRGDELRRRALHRRAASPLGWRRDRRRLHPVQCRVRGRGGSHRRHRGRLARRPLAFLVASPAGRNRQRPRRVTIRPLCFPEPWPPFLP